MFPTMSPYTGIYLYIYDLNSVKLMILLFFAHKTSVPNKTMIKVSALICMLHILCIL